jgi:O-acetyl-ADP-ribose deacetylase (regulator of RNase III)
MNVLWYVASQRYLTIILAHQKGFKSMVFPLIGTGSGGFNQDRVKAIMEDELQKMDYPLDVKIVAYKKR